MRGVLAPLFVQRALDRKRHEDVSHSESFAKLGGNSFPFAFICVFRGLKAFSKNNKLAARPA